MAIKLFSLRLRNFRGYVDTKICFDNDLNVIIGKNDVGKSTILEALEKYPNILLLNRFVKLILTKN